MSVFKFVEESRIQGTQIRSRRVLRIDSDALEKVDERGWEQEYRLKRPASVDDVIAELEKRGYVYKPKGDEDEG